MTLRPPLLALAALLLPALLVLTGPPAHACSCAGASLPGHLEGADAVLTGTIEGPDGPGPGTLSGTAQWEVAVSRVFKGGPVGEVIAVRTASSGAACGWEFIEPGVEYVAFLSLAEDGGRVPTYTGSLCDGTRPASPRLLERVEALAGPPSPPAEGVPAPRDPDTWWVAAGAALAAVAVVLAQVGRHRG